MRTGKALPRGAPRPTQCQTHLSSRSNRPCEVKLLNLPFEKQQEQPAAVMKQYELSFALLTEQVKGLQQEGASSSRVEKAVAKTTADAELELKKKLPYVPYAPNNPFPTRPDTMEDLTPKVYNLYGDKTHALMSKKSNSSMKYEQMILGPALAYFHDAVVYEEDTMDWLQALPAGQPLDNIDELYDRMVRAHNTKKGAYSLFCNCYMTLTLRALLDAAGGGTDAERDKLAFMEKKVNAGTERVVGDSVMMKWLDEFDATKFRAVMTTAKQAAVSAKASS
ncbi:hypothetical protein CYMTET_54590 [Cymbomonas tetramitiformis]|uniref:Uncharacterized protein n=1 Tax=Cymbomonas tetramitiformis TaxID=36881 RepID=A0AAE0BGD9_9CHLO|nr:hypothetical protein CYMTET_54590 [Cymbomonas tetramitiformis]